MLSGRRGGGGTNAGRELERKRDSSLRAAWVRGLFGPFRRRHRPCPGSPRAARGDSSRRTYAGWLAAFSVTERRGYSGVGIYSKFKPYRVEIPLGELRFDVEGRFIAAHFRTGRGRLAVVNGYFPKGSEKDRDNSRVGYKLAFYRAVFDRSQLMRRRCPVLVMGYYNTAHREIDLARPKSNVRNNGFLPEEGAGFGRWLEAGWVDTFRALHSDESGHYTWWLQWGGARERNVGWRTDHVLASSAAMKRTYDAFIWPDQRGSDHCPVGVDIDL